MVGVGETEETMSHEQGEVEPSSLLLIQANTEQNNQKNNNTTTTQYPFSSLGRQCSIYSLTLDEFQHTLNESGKNFGSMNMDEFLTSIWTAEENQANNNDNNTNNDVDDDDNNNNNNHGSYGNGGGGGGGGGAAAAADLLSLSKVGAEKIGVASQPSLTRQGSLTLPPPLFRKTVEEVWSEIHSKGRHDDDQQRQRQSTSASAATRNNTINHLDSVGDIVRNSDSTPRQPTFGEMTLEDFLVKAGVVREPAPLTTVSPTPTTQSLKTQQYGMYHNNNNSSSNNNNNSAGAGPSFVNRVTGNSSGGLGYPSAVAFGDSAVYGGSSSRNGAYTQQQQPPAPPPPPPGVCYGGRGVNGGGGGYGVGAVAAQAPMGLAVPMSPVSSDGICGSQVENSGNQFGLDIGGVRGRKRSHDGPVEKVVERRQRRMIKNRESAARSRARKQAYTVELEAELNQLREENAHLKQALEEIERKQKQQYFEEMKMKAQTRVSIAKDKLKLFRRHLSCPL